MIGQLVDRCLMELSAQTGYTVPQEYEIYFAGPKETHKNKETKHQTENHKCSSAWTLWR